MSQYQRRVWQSGKNARKSSAQRVVAFFARFGLLLSAMFLIATVTEAHVPDENASLFLVPIHGAGMAVPTDITSIVVSHSPATASVSVRPGYAVTVTLALTDNGSPSNLELTYNAAVLAYDSIRNSSPVASDDAIDDGVLNWTALPAGTAALTVYFTGRAQGTSELSATSGATSSNTDTVTIAEPRAGKALIGDYVWYDVNDDGLKNDGDTGINGVIVELWKDMNGNGTFETDSDTLIISTTTAITTAVAADGNDGGASAGNGFYQFSVEPPQGINPDTYFVYIPPSEFGAGEPLEGLMQTNTGNVNAYSGPNPRVEVVNVNDAGPYLVNDFGYYYPRVELGNRVWQDDGTGGGTADDGLINGSEIGISGVAVYLYQDTNGDGVYTQGSDAYISNTVTSNSGYYTFTNLTVSASPDTRYLVVIADTNFTVGSGVLDGYSSSTGVSTPEPTVDNDDNGVSVGAYVTTEAISLTAAFEFEAGMTVNPDDVVRYDVDFGFVPPAGAIIRIVKSANPADGTDFEFTSAIGPGATAISSTFQLDSTNTARSFSGLAAGTYTFTESSLAGWALTNLNCAIPTNSSVTYLPSGHTASAQTNDSAVAITVASGDTVQCTYTNTKLGQIVVRKETLPAGDAQAFDFTTSGSGTSAMMTTTAAPAGFQLTDGSTQTISALLPGTYTINELNLAKWTLTDIECSGGADSTFTYGSSGTFSAGDTTAEVALAAGDVITCLYTNTKQSQITVVKDAQPDADTIFTFTGTGVSPGSFQLIDDGATSASASQVFTPLLPGSVSITETLIAGWTLQDVNCAGAAAVAYTDVGASIDVQPGEDITCTFTNIQPTFSPQVTVKKSNNAGDATVRSGEPVSFTLMITNSGDITITTLSITDTYNSVFLSYVGTDAPTPPPTQQTNMLSWTLTADDGVIPAHGLAPNGAGAISIVVKFSAAADTTSQGVPTQHPLCPQVTQNTQNLLTVSGVANPSGGVPSQAVPAASSCDDQLVETPTAVMLSERSVSISSGGTAIAWTTIAETDIIGFNVWRVDQTGVRTKVNKAMIAARHTGQSLGAAYSVVDEGVSSSERYSYILEMKLVDGNSDQHYLGSTSRITVYLPIMAR